MRMACFWFVSVGLLLPFCSAYGQWQGASQDGSVENAPTVCNDGTIPVSVARAFFDGGWVLKGDLWEIRGWDSVAPGKCRPIGEVRRYFSGNLLNRTHSVTLLAFAFQDSTGIWGAVHVPDTTDGIFKPSNEHLCVSHDAFSNWHPVSQGGPGSDCASFYASFTDVVGTSLPADWKADEVPPFGGDLPSMGFHASSGVHGEIWIGSADSGDGYAMHYQVVSAPLAAPSKP
jgi:hypothetical protein